MALQQDIERLAIDRVHPDPRSLPGNDLVERAAIEIAPFGRQTRPIHRDALGAVERLTHAHDRPVEIDAGSLHVEGQRLHAFKSLRSHGTPPA